MSRASEFPIGATVGSGDHVISQRLHGEPARGIYRGHDTLGLRSVIVTLTSRQTRPYDDLASELMMPFEGIAPLLHIGEVRYAGAALGAFDGMVEEEPEGSPLSEVPRPVASSLAGTIGREVALVLARLHAAGSVVGDLHPALVYVRPDGKVSGILPRSLRFASTAESPDHALAPLFDEVYQAPELFASRATSPAVDVFSVAAILAHLVSGQHPFVGDWAAPQQRAILGGERRAWDGPEGWRELLDRGLAAAPERRISLDELVRGLDRK